MAARWCPNASPSIVQRVLSKIHYLHTSSCYFVQIYLLQTRQKTCTMYLNNKDQMVTRTLISLKRLLNINAPWWQPMIICLRISSAGIFQAIQKLYKDIHSSDCEVGKGVEIHLLVVSSLCVRRSYPTPSTRR